MLSASFWLALVFAAVTAVGVRLIFRSHQKRLLRGKKKRGVTPSKNDQYVNATDGAGSSGDNISGASAGYFVTRDPQVYAKAFVPNSNK